MKILEGVSTTRKVIFGIVTFVVFVNVYDAYQKAFPTPPKDPAVVEAERKAREEKIAYNQKHCEEKGFKYLEAPYDRCVTQEEFREVLQEGIENMKEYRLKSANEGLK